MNHSPRIYLFALWAALSLSLVLAASTLNAVPHLAFLAVCFLAVLYRIVRRKLLQHLGYREVASHWTEPDPLGPVIDRIIPMTGKTIQLREQEDEYV